MGVRVSYKNLPDSSITQKRTGYAGEGTPTFSELYSPLGVGGHPDHLFVRDFALSIWKGMKGKTVMFFYEDLPYAARMKDLGATEKELAIEVGEVCGRVEARCLPLTKNALWRKRLYSFGIRRAILRRHLASLRISPSVACPIVKGFSRYRNHRSRLFQGMDRSSGLPSSR